MLGWCVVTMAAALSLMPTSVYEATIVIIARDLCEDSPVDHKRLALPLPTILHQKWCVQTVYTAS